MKTAKTLSILILISVALAFLGSAVEVANQVTANVIYTIGGVIYIVCGTWLAILTLNK